MKKQLRRLVRPAWATLLFSLGLPLLAQGPAPRLAGPIAGGPQTVLPGSHPARVDSATDLGAVPADQTLKGITLALNRSAAQETALQTLLAAQQNTASPLYHQWLTPDQFAARFGVADADINAVESWLQAQGFTIASVSRSRSRITFSGNAGQVAQAFGTSLHHYDVHGVTHTAPATDLAVPAALAPMVSAVLHLSDFRPHAHLHHLQPAFTSSKSNPQNHYLTPIDLATMYDVNPVYNAGFNGAGQSIAIAGESFIQISDITAFQAAEGLPANPPTLVLEPGTGVSSALDDGDEGESDIDVEYSSSMARGAKVYLVYTGDDQSYGALDALAYAVDQDIAPIISNSYGECELDFGANLANEFNTQIGEQANAQGQTILSAAGDQGSTDCAESPDLSAVQVASLAVDVPGSLPTVTSMGGTQMAPGDSAAGSNQYWTAASGSDVIGSLLSYVPEVVWNEDSADGGLFAGGGGASVIFTKPTWQVGVPGIPSTDSRLVPDLALQTSGGNPGYLICSSDSSVLGGYGIATACTNGFRDSATGVLEANYGGTSFAAPIMAGLLAVLNQATHSAGQGNINPTLYTLASNPTTYASAFHDVVTGTNGCVANTVYDVAGTSEDCTYGSTGYSAGVGYDEATGLGSIDFAKLVAAWPVATSAIATATASSTTTLSAASISSPLNTSDVVTITVAAASSGAAVPTGSVTIFSNGAAAGTLPLSNGQATFTFPGAAAPGAYVVQASYTGDGTYLPSTGSVSITVGTTVTAGTFTLAAQAITVATDNVASGNVQITPGTAYTGLVNLSVIFPSGAPTLCYEFSSDPVSTFYEGVSTGPQTVTLEVGEGTVCPTSSSPTPQARPGSSGLKLHAGNLTGTKSNPTKRMPAITAFAGLLLAGVTFRRRGRRLSALLAVALFAIVGVGLSGCGSSSTVARPPTVASPATYTVTVVGTDSVTSSITSSTTFTLTLN